LLKHCSTRASAGDGLYRQVWRHHGSARAHQLEIGVYDEWRQPARGTIPPRLNGEFRTNAGRIAHGQRDGQSRRALS
jgi:hypothetical protein